MLKNLTKKQKEIINEFSNVEDFKLIEGKDIHLILSGKVYVNGKYLFLLEEDLVDELRFRYYMGIENKSWLFLKYGGITVYECNNDELLSRFVRPYDKKELITAVKNEIINLREYWKDKLDELESDIINIRLQLIDGTYKIHTGDSQYDQNHQGSWGSYEVYIAEDDLEKEQEEIAKYIVEEALNNFEK